jgi:hypothetical protein
MDIPTWDGQVGGLHEQVHQEGGLHEQVHQEGGLHGQVNWEGGLHEQVHQEGGLQDQVHQEGRLHYQVHQERGLHEQVHQEGGLHELVHQEIEEDERVQALQGRKKVAVKAKKKVMETVEVMFVDQTMMGELAKQLQKAENEIAEMVWYKVRVAESSGTQLCGLLPNINPCADQHCDRAGCYTCNQGDENLQNCRKRNILYESSCILCNPPQDEGGGSKGD